MSLRNLMILVAVPSILCACGGVDPSASSSETTTGTVVQAEGGGVGMCTLAQGSDGTWWQNGYCASWRPVEPGNTCPGQYQKSQCPVIQVAHEYHDNICGFYQNPNSSCTY
jgi:hypothetical protein